MSWQGSAGAACYDVERAESADGPWSIAGADVSDAQVQHRPLFVDESAAPGKSYFYRAVARNSSGASDPSSAFGPVRIMHRTLVDEMWNDSRMYAKEGKLQFQENEARKFKEDCHRLSGEPGSAVIYHARGPIHAVRIFLYSQSPGPDVALSFSSDGRKFDPIEADVTRFTTWGESTYGFWKATLVSAKPAGNASGDVKVQFRSNCQISRIEIDHDRIAN